MKERQPVTHYLKNYEPPAYLVRSTRLLFQLYEDGARVTATLQLARNPAHALAVPLVLDGVELKTERVTLNGRDLAPQEYLLVDDTLVIDRVPEHFELVTAVWILPQENTCLEGLYRSSRMFCTQCEAQGFRRITWYPDRPDVMAPFEVTIEADRQKYPVLLSNGNPVAEGETGAGRHWVTWQDPFPKPSYLFALVAGDLRWVEDHFSTASGRDVTLRIYVEPENLDKCDHAMDSLKRAMRWDEEVYGREYDLDRFNIVAVNDFNMGAMENKGLNIFNASCVLANPQTASDQAFERIEAIVAHEYFHNWSGNRVTCRDWFQLSLKEGFTVFRDARYTADRYGHGVKRIDDATLMRTAQFAEDAGPMAHAVRPESYMEIANFYTLTVYEKGAEVVGMLHRLLGPGLFRKGTDLYFDRHDGQAVTTDDFVACMAEVSGRDLTQFKRWYSQAGTPRVEVRDDYDASTRRYTLSFQQRVPPTPGQPEKQPMHIPIEVALFLPDGGRHPLSHPVLELTESEQSFVIDGVPARPIPSLLRHFSAPVKLHYPHDRHQLRFLMTHDDDSFCRWDAAQTLALQILDEQIEGCRAGQVPALDPDFIEAWCQLFREPLKDPGVLARMTQLPSVALMVERHESVDLDAVLVAREQVLLALVEAARDGLIAAYDMLAATPEDMSPNAMGRRALKNHCLALLAYLDDDAGLERAVLQQRGSRLMTDEQGALAALLQSHDQERCRRALEHFEQRWQGDALVMETWFSLQASSQRFTTLTHVRELLAHPLFSERNPNKVRAVIGAFANQNWRGFHHPDGSGYAFLVEWVLRMNRLNPQIASRLVTPLTRWRKYAGTRGELMRAALEQIRREGSLSPDVHEVVLKSLA